VRTERKPERVFLDVIFADGGLGDHICRLPAINYIQKNYPWVSITCHVPKYFVELGQNVLPKVIWRAFQGTKIEVPEHHKVVVARDAEANTTSLRRHLVDHAFNTIVDEDPHNEDKNYLAINEVDVSSFNLPEKFVVVTTGYTSKTREWKAEVTNEVVEWIISQGYVPVFMGKHEAYTGLEKNDVLKGNFSDQINFDRGLDLRDKTSLVEAASIMKKSSAVVGLDNGLLHLAGMTEVPIVAGFTTVHPAHRLPYRNGILGHNAIGITPPEDLGCRFCQSKLNFVYEPFTECFERNLRCIKEQTSTPYIEALEYFLSGS
jgi:ADP-heptose:LPS heptosyltransferase